MKQEKLLTVTEYTKKYLKSQKHSVKPSTYVSRKCKANKIIKLLGNTPMANLSHSDIIDFIDELHQCYANKSINEFLTILRAIFLRAHRDGVISSNPMKGVRNFKTVKPKPNPFTKEEIKKLHDTPSICTSGKNACLFNILTGLRISELLALGWEDVDFAKKLIHIRRAKVLGDYKTPKTAESTRTVQLNELSIDILLKQFALTGNKRPLTISVLQDDSKTRVSENVGFVFYNSKTEQPFIHAAQYNKTFFRPFLEKAGVTTRGAGQLRHTFASQNLTAGISKDWLARQMGHNGTEMIDAHYGEWIEADAPDYANAVAANLSYVFGHSVSEPEKMLEIPAEHLALVQALYDKPDLFALVKGLLSNGRNP